VKPRLHNRRWKNFLIRKDVQLPIIAANLGLLAVVVGVLIAVLLSPFYYDMLVAEDPWAQNISGNLFLVLLQRTSLALFLILIAAMIHQIVLSHRIFGPLVNFNHAFEKMARGDFSRKVYLRKHDFLKAEAEQLNAVIDRLNSDRQSLDEQLDQIRATLALLAQNEVSPSAAQLIGRLERSVDACRGTVSGGSL